MMSILELGRSIQLIERMAEEEHNLLRKNGLRIEAGALKRELEERTKNIGKLPI